MLIELNWRSLEYAFIKNLLHAIKMEYELDRMNPSLMPVWPVCWINPLEVLKDRDKDPIG